MAGALVTVIFDTASKVVDGREGIGIVQEENLATKAQELYRRSRAVCQ